MLKAYYFVYRVRVGESVDFRCPIGGVVAHAWTPTGLAHAVFGKADCRFPCRPRQILILRRIRDKIGKRQVAMLDRDWEHKHAQFEELMTVS